MDANVHHIHIDVKARCAPAGIFVLDGQGYALCMARKLSKTFIREWRQHRNKTLVQVGEHLHMTHGQLSRIERGVQPYNQEMLETLADLYKCEPVDLLIRDPLQAENIWSIWDHATKAEKAQIEAVASALVDSDKRRPTG